MHQVFAVILYTTLAGAALTVGGLIARIERLRPYWLEQELRHGVLAFGGGILLAAVALVLVPEGIRNVSVVTASVSVILGGGLVLLVDRRLSQTGTSASNLMAALLDFVPEAVALGALMATQPNLAVVLAAFIGLQNLPEGFNAYREMIGRSDVTPGRALALLTSAALIGPVCGTLGYWVLSETARAASITMLFASGGILYLIFQDIAPQAKLARHWGPPFGAVLGFTLGLIGNMALRS